MPLSYVTPIVYSFDQLILNVLVNLLLGKKMKIICNVLSFVFIFTCTTAISADSVTGSRNVSDILESLRAQSSPVSYAAIKPGGDRMINYASPFATWSFVTRDHYAYPSVVRRELKQKSSGETYVELTTVCQAAQTQCDRLTAELN
ncbi:MAG: hypothetical protein V4525_16005 [Pseudomonadota bacterium]